MKNLLNEIPVLKYFLIANLLNLLLLTYSIGKSPDLKAVTYEAKIIYAEQQLQRNNKNDLMECSWIKIKEENYLLD